MINKEKCCCSNKCRNGSDGCYSLHPEECVRFLPLVNTNLTDINFTIETPPNITTEKFSQYFSNWIESMGWSYVGVAYPHEEIKE